MLNFSWIYSLAAFLKFMEIAKKLKTSSFNADQCILPCHFEGEN